MFDEFSEKREDLNKFIVSIILITILLVGIDLVFSQEAWNFAILIVFAWPLEDRFFKFIRELIDVEQTTSPWGFLIYIVAVLVAAVTAAFLWQQFLLPFHLPTLGNETSTLTENVTTFLNSTITLSSSQTSSPFHPISWIIVGVSALTSAVSYLITNVSELNEKYGWF